jgi:hypothetical protein
LNALILVRSFAMLSIVSMTMFSGIALPAAAEEPVYDPTYCLNSRFATNHVANRYKWKDPDRVDVTLIGEALFQVIVHKGGKKGIYEFDGCTMQSRKIR